MHSDQPAKNQMANTQFHRLHYGSNNFSADVFVCALRTARSESFYYEFPMFASIFYMYSLILTSMPIYSEYEL